VHATGGEGVELYFDSSLTSLIDEEGWSVSHLCHFTPGARAPSTSLIGNLLGSKACMIVVQRRKFLITTGNRTTILRLPN
jgi:hypothetical protein